MLAVHAAVPVLKATEPPVCACALDDRRMAVSRVAVACAAALFADDRLIPVVRLAELLVLALADEANP